MAARGFRYDSRSRTFRRTAGEFTQIVNIQVGVRSLEGRFTVNLGVFHPAFAAASAPAPDPARPMEYECLPECRARLGLLQPTAFTRFFQRRIRNPRSFIEHWLVTPFDKWWRFGAGAVQVGAALAAVKRMLLERGLPWLDANSDVGVMEHALAERKRRLATRGG